MSDGEWAAAIDAIVTQKLRVIRENREVYITAWLAETGLLPSESALVEQQHADGRVSITVHRRECACSRWSDE
jgi:hypothetical protein